MKSKASSKKRSKKGSGPDYQYTPDIENQLETLKYGYTSDIENQLNKEPNINIETYKDTDTDIDKPKNIVEYVPEQRETFVQPIEQDVELNIPGDTSIDLGDSGYGVYDTQFYGGITKKRRRGRKNKTKRRKNKKSNKLKKYK
jgi:hypothetical protein